MRLSRKQFWDGVGGRARAVVATMLVAFVGNDRAVSDVGNERSALLPAYSRATWLSILCHLSASHLVISAQMVACHRHLRQLIEAVPASSPSPSSGSTAARTNPTDDVWSILATGELEEFELGLFFMVLTFGGSETTRNALAPSGRCSKPSVRPHRIERLPRFLRVMFSTSSTLQPAG
jgi:hypothetical protein